MYNEEITNITNLPHGFIGGYHIDHWCIWESEEDYKAGLYPYEGEMSYENGKPSCKKILTESEAIAFANKCHRSLIKKYGENYNNR